MIEEYGDLPETLEAETGGGGHHIVFEFPELAALGNSRGCLPDGLDVRGEGGYIVAAPSLHASGRRYRWRNDFRPAPAPEWFIKLLSGEGQGEALQNSETSTRANSRASIGPVIAEGGRNNALYRIGCSMRGNGAELPEIEAELFDINERRCSPPLPAEDVQKIARSAARKAANRVAVGV